MPKKKEELLDHKNSVASQLEKTNEKVSKDLSEWKNLEEEIKQADDNWYGGKERLAQANTNQLETFQGALGAVKALTLIRAIHVT